MYIGNDISKGRSTIYYFDASGGETAITTATRPAVSLSYDPGFVSVYLNGVKLHDTDFTATTGTSITGLSPALVSGDVVIIEASHVFSVANVVNATGGTFTGNVTHNGDVETSTTTKVKQKGAFMQSSTHQAMVLGG